MLRLDVWDANERQESHQLAFALEKFSSALTGNLERFIEVGDSSGAGMIWTCCVTCLAHLAALCHLISQTEPSSRDSMGDLCDLALDKLGNVSHEVQIEEYSRFDVLTGVRILVVLLRMSKALTKISN